MKGSKKDQQLEQVILAEERRERVAVAYVRGVTQAEISRREKVSQKTISLDLKKVRAGWAKNAERAVGERVLEEIAKIDDLELLAREGWEKSCRDAEARSQEVEEALRSPKGEDGERGEAALVPVSRKLKVTSKGQAGDERFLARIAWCVETRLKLLDAFPREKKVPDGQDGAKLVVFIEDMHAPGRRPSDSIEARLAAEAASLADNGVTVDQAPAPANPPENGRNGQH